MVYDRKEPTFSTSSRGATSNSSTTSSVNTNASNPARPSPDKVAPRPRVDNRPQVMIQKQPSALLWFAMFFAILALSASVYLFLQFNAAQQTITNQQGRLAELENKLSLSDDESTQSLTVLTASVKGLNENVALAMSEVDKLWATRNANLEKLAAAKSEVNKNIDKTSEQSQQAIDSLNKQLKQSLVLIKQSSSEQELLSKSLRERVAEQDQTLASIQSVLKNSSNSTEKLKSVTESLDQFKQQLTTLSRRTIEYDEAIESFDKFRLITNRDLIALKNRAGIAPQ